MSAKSRKQSNQSSVIELRADSFTLPVLKLSTTAIGAIIEQLNEKVDQAPEFFRNAPLVLDIFLIADDDPPIKLESLVNKIQAVDLTPVGIRGGSQSLNDVAQSIGLAVLSESRPAQKAIEKETQDTSESVKQEQKQEQGLATEVGSSAMIITQPVRSGQRIYAKNCDLVILATVSAGAELIADGNIHIYGTLRGRALAGVGGNTDSRIFCQDLQAELVSISGQYQISEGIDDSLQGKPVQVYLSDDSLLIDDL